MEKIIIMNDKKIFSITIFIIVIPILCVTLNGVYKNHQEKLILVSNKRIIEAAQKCYLEQKCLDEKITLEKLYEEKYLEEESNPITKEIYNYSSYVQLNDSLFEFFPNY